MWTRKLPLFIQEKRDQPFEWGVNDCCMFACDWIILLTGFDPADAINLRGAYSSKLEAIRILSRFGGVEMLAETFALEREWAEVPVSYAQRGDVVTFQTEDGTAIGVCDGLNSLFMSPNGILFMPTLRCSRAWHIH